MTMPPNVTNRDLWSQYYSYLPSKRPVTSLRRDPDPAASLGSIVLDIFLEGIVPYLHVEDIVALRGVNRHLYQLTHEPIIWKHIVQEINVPLPPTRPTLKFHTQSTSYEFEHIVTRAISLEDNWRRRNPGFTARTTFGYPYEVLEIKLLPGGKYLIASVRDEHRFHILLHHLDHPAGPHLLARLPIPSRAYNLEAKYMMFPNIKVDEEGNTYNEPDPVIMIAYATRTYFEGGPMDHDPTDFSGNTDIDPPARFRHEVVCVRVNLLPLEHLTGAHRDPNGEHSVKHKLWSSKVQDKPFLQTLVMPVEHEVDIICLYEKTGVPWVCVHQHIEGKRTPEEQAAFPDDYIRFGNLVSRHISSLICAPSLLYRLPASKCPKRIIKAILPLPQQNEILAFFTTTYWQGSKKQYLHTVETFDLPTGVTGTRFSQPNGSAQVAESMPEKDYSRVQICDYVRESTHGQTEYTLRGESHTPPPISIYLETKNPQGVEHQTIWAQLGDFNGQRDVCRYFWNGRPPTIQTNYRSTPYTAHFVAGTFRALVYTTEPGDRTDTPSLHSLRRYINPEFQEGSCNIDRITRTSDAERRRLRKMPQNVYGDLVIPGDISEKYRVNGLAAIAWDERIGRVCMVSGGIGRCMIDVLDFASAAPLDHRFADPDMELPEGYVVDDISHEGIVAKRVETIMEVDEERSKLDAAMMRRAEFYGSDCDMVDISAL